MCAHEDFEANVAVARLERGIEGEQHLPMRFQADVTIKCTQCGLPFRFIGLPAGIDLEGASVSIDGCEGRFAIAPKGEVRVPLNDTECRGFTVRKTK